MREYIDSITTLLLDCCTELACIYRDLNNAPVKHLIFKVNFSESCLTINSSDTNVP